MTAPCALVIDDSAAIRLILTRILVEMGWEVIQAEDGQAALDMLSAHPATRLALVDWNMPVMNGLDFVRAVRAESRWDDLILMMVTTEAEPENIIAALEAGANEYVMKPFTRDVLTDKLEWLGFPTGPAVGADADAL